MANKIRIAGYCRTSGNNKNLSIERQKIAIKDYVKTTFHEYELDFYEDANQSGSSFKNRPGYQTMRMNLLAGEYDMLIFEDPSKFSRSIFTSIYELTGLKNSGIKIISIAHDVKYKNDDEEFAEN